MKCSYIDCTNKIVARKYCTLHYQRWKKHGDPSITQAYKHKMSYSREYSAWRDMKYRCYNPNVKSYKYYGARGITVCDRWLESFNNFIDDVGAKPSNKHSLDRIDNNGNYEPNNVKWSTQSEQRQNSRSFGKSGYKGVCFNKRSKSWQVTLWVNHKPKHIGYYKKLEDAVNARKKAELKYISL